MDLLTPIHVKIGEIKIAKSPDTLRATLGSCVGIAFIWKEKDLYGLAHCLLPEAPHKTFEIGAKFVSQAVPSLLKLMKIPDSEKSQVRVFVAGGGNMIAQSTNKNHVGNQNIEAAVKYLNCAGMTIQQSDVGGNLGRQISVDCTTGVVEIQPLIIAKEGPL